MKYLKNSAAHRTRIEWRDCKYHVVFFWLPVTPDSHAYVVLDADGNVIAPVRESASYDKLSLPAYPLRALARKITGTVYLHVWIQPDGVVSGAIVEQIYPREAIALADGLAEAVHGWKFNPAVTIYGDPIAEEAIVPVRFSIGNHAPLSVAERPAALPKDVQVLDTIEVEGVQ